MNKETAKLAIDLSDGREFEITIGSPSGEVKTIRDTLPTITFDYAPLSVIDIPYVVEKLMIMHVAALTTVSAQAKKALAVLMEEKKKK